MSSVPEIRIRRANQAPVRPNAKRVLYWMTAARRLDSNFALQRAVEWARKLDRPLLVLEALRCGYRWASDRHHRFVLDGMAEHAGRLRGGRAAYYPYVEPEEGAGKGLLEVLAADAAVVVTDDFPAFFLPRMVDAAAGKLPVRLEAVDSNGLLPLAATDEEHASAYHFRRRLQALLPEHLSTFPAPHPLRGDPLSPAPPIAERIRERWPPAEKKLLDGSGGALSRLPVDHEVAPIPDRGGTRAAVRRLERFLERGLPRYADEGNDPDAEATSGLSPYLHWGHISAHRIFRALAEREGWSPARLSGSADGSREGWWGMSGNAEAFLDELVTWRELGYHFCAHRDDYDRYESLPGWARKTLEAHADDDRPHLYEREAFEGADTHDPLWNAAQRQLRREGTIHNYLRMLWGKKILEWTPDAHRALEIMIELNNRWGADGRDPNSYSGIFWCLGRFDRGWPERDVFGTVRYMSSASTRRKRSLERYLERYGKEG